MNLDKYKEFDETIINLAKIKAHSMIVDYDFTELDRDDLEQELLLEILEQMPKYDAGQTTFSTFASLAIHQRGMQMVLAQNSIYTDFRSSSSNVNVCDGSPQDEDNPDAELLEILCEFSPENISKTSAMSFLLATKLGTELAA